MLTEPSAEEMERLRHQFQALDTNGDGHLNSAEIANACQALGLTVSQQAITDMIREADTNFNGLLQFDDFVALLHRYSPDDGSVWGALLAASHAPPPPQTLSPEQIKVLSCSLSFFFFPTSFLFFFFLTP